MSARLVRLALIVGLCLLPASPAYAWLPDRDDGMAPKFPEVSVTAPSAVVLDDATGEVLYEKNAHQRRAPASITKIVTALVALRYDSPSRVVRVMVDWSDFSDSTLMGVSRGARMSIEDLLYGLLLPSGNDAAVALAWAVAGSETNFVALMNEDAAKMGLQDTHFANPHGLDQEGHYTSAYDIAVLAREAMRNPLFARIVSTKEHEVTSMAGSYYDLTNINKFIWYYPGADGVKHGFTDNAGLTLVGTASRDGRRAYVAVMGSWNYVNDATILMDAFFSMPARQPVSSASATTARPFEVDDSIPHAWIDIPGSRTGVVRPALRAQ